jgi:hypothetical protein
MDIVESKIYYSHTNTSGRQQQLLRQLDAAMGTYPDLSYQVEQQAPTSSTQDAA